MAELKQALQFIIFAIPFGIFFFFTPKVLIWTRRSFILAWIFFVTAFLTPNYIAMPLLVLTICLSVISLFRIVFYRPPIKS